MRKSVLLVSIVLVSVVWGSLLIADDEMCVPMGEITLKPLVEESKRSEVVFPHAGHFSYACQRCHHKWGGEDPIVGCTTSGCHDLEKVAKTDDGKLVKDPVLKMRYYKNAFHDMCIGCHKEIKKQNKLMEASKAALGEELPATGPTGCVQCHPKE
jgi:hypothetical protein